MVLTSSILVPSGALVSDLFQDSRGGTQLLVKNCFYQEFVEVRVPLRSRSHGPFSRVEVESDDRSDVPLQPRLPGPKEMSHQVPEAVTVTPTAGGKGQSDPVELLIQTETGPMKQTAFHRGSLRKVPDSEKTTLMIRNLPVKATQQTLLQTWVADGSYDFLYLPFSFEQHRNLGYAFINFSSHDSAIAFYKAWQGRVPEWPNAKKKLKLSWAYVQGRDNNLLQFAHYKIARIKNVVYQPAIFEGTTRLPFLDVLASLQPASDAGSSSTRCWSDEE